MSYLLPARGETQMSYLLPARGETQMSYLLRGGGGGGVGDWKKCNGHRKSFHKRSKTLKNAWLREAYSTCD